jgi:hypothetical protein
MSRGSGSASSDDTKEFVPENLLSSDFKNKINPISKKSPN